jgi:hypothetical protein
LNADSPFKSGAASVEHRRESRAAIDAAFEGMAEDVEYQRESQQIMEEFAASDAEALALADLYMGDEGRRRSAKISKPPQSNSE